MAKGIYRQARKAKQQQAEEVFEDGTLVGYWCWTWNHEGTKQIRVWIPAR